LRIGLVAFIVAVLLGVFLSLPAIDSSYAQAPAAAPADVLTPACDPKTLLNCSSNSGDTAWMPTSVALVLMMAIPGLGRFYGGMVSKKNVGDTAMTSFAVTCFVTARSCSGV
jgi:Amt family ammonium transporter